MFIIAGLQGLMLLAFGTKLFSDFTGMGFFASLIFGGFGSCALLGIMFALLPRITLALATGFWGLFGYSLAQSMFGDVGSSIAGAVLLGAMGGGANYGLMQDFLGGYARGQALAGGQPDGGSPRSNVPSMTEEQAEQMEAIWRSLYVLKGIDAVKLSTFSRMDKKFVELFGIPGSEAIGSASNAHPSTDDVMTSLMRLSDSDLLSKDEMDAIDQRVEEWFEKPVPVAARPAAPATPPATKAERALDEDEKSLLAGNLFRLAENRAIGLDTFSRLQQRLDPTYDTARVRAENFPYLDEADKGDLETVERLFETGLIDRAEYQRAVQVILPHLPHANIA
mgnify:CR=1 FL=1